MGREGTRAPGSRVGRGLMPKKGKPQLARLSPEELEQIKRFIETTEIDVIDDEMRALVAKHWPWLLEKLPPRVTH
jgi:hypothetical protein